MWLSFTFNKNLYQLHVLGFCFQGVHRSHDEGTVLDIASIDLKVNYSTPVKLAKLVTLPTTNLRE